MAPSKAPKAPKKVLKSTPAPSPASSTRPSKLEPIKSKPSMSNSDVMVTLYAGDSNKKFVIHQEFACHYSPVLNAAFEGEFIEGQTKTYRLQDTTIEAIRLLVQWLYSQHLDLENTRYPNSEVITDATDKFNHWTEGLVHLWVLADRLLIPTLQNQVASKINALRIECKRLPTSLIPFVYERTATGSPLRLLFVDMVASSSSTGIDDIHELRYPKEMLVDLVNRLAGATSPLVRATLEPSMNFKTGRYDII